MKEPKRLEDYLDIVNRSRDIAYRASKRDGQEGVQVIEMRAEWKRIVKEARQAIFNDLMELVGPDMEIDFQQVTNKVAMGYGNILKRELRAAIRKWAGVE